MNELLALDPVKTLVLTGLVMGGVELVKRAFDKDWRVVWIIIASAVIGGIGGVILGVTALEGIVYGITATGYVTLAQNFGR